MHIQHGDRISLLLFFKTRKVCYEENRVENKRVNPTGNLLYIFFFCFYLKTCVMFSAVKENKFPIVIIVSRGVLVCIVSLYSAPVGQET
jgi:hypothetical protein